MFKRKNQKLSPRVPTNSGRANVFSYYANRSPGELPAGRYQDLTKPKNRWWWRYLPSLLAGLALVVCLFYATTLTITPRILPLAETTPNILRSNDTYQTAARDILADSILNRSKLSINTTEIARQLSQQFPELGEVSVTIPLLGRRPVIEITPSTPALILGSQTGAYVVDINGRALLKPSDVPNFDHLDLPTVIDDVGLDITPGKTVLPTATVQFVTTLVGQLEAKQLSIKALNLPAAANELHLRLEGIGYYVKFNLQNDPKEQVGAFLAVKQRLEQDNSVPAEYIDVRIAERAYYK